MQNMEKVNLKKTNLHLMFPNYILFTSEKRKRKKRKLQEREVKITKSKMKMKTKNVCQGETRSR